MMQRTLNNLCHRSFLQHTRPVAPVKLLIQLVEAQLVQLVYLLARARFGMTAEPILSFALAIAGPRSRQGILETERDEVGNSFLAPVRQSPAADAGRTILLERLERQRLVVGQASRLPPGRLALGVLSRSS